MSIGLLVLPVAWSCRQTVAVAQNFLHVLLSEADLPRAYLLYAATDFAEHNPEIGNGVAAKLAYFKARQAHADGTPRPAQWADVIDNVIFDGDLFAVQRHVFTGAGDRGRVFVDIWRIANNKIVEHWDVIQAAPVHSRNSNTMWCNKGSDYASGKALGDTLASPTCGTPVSSATRADSLALVQAYGAMIGKGDIDTAVHRFNAANYVQHSPDIPDGPEALISHLSSNAANRSTSFVVRVLTQGDRVLIHRHVTRPNDALGTVVVDIFRIADGKLVEHWDVKQSVPPSSANGHTVW